MNPITKAINESDEEYSSRSKLYDYKNGFLLFDENDCDCPPPADLRYSVHDFIHASYRKILEAAKEMIISTKDEKMFRIPEIINRLDEAIKDIK